MALQGKSLITKIEKTFVMEYPHIQTHTHAHTHPVQLTCVMQQRELLLTVVVVLQNKSF